MQNQSKQRNLPLLAAVTAPIELPMEIVQHCLNHLDAIRLCINTSNRSHQSVCDDLGIDKGHWSRIMSGRAHFPTRKLPDLMRLCGNIAPLQWLAGAMGYVIKKDDVSKRKAELLAELAEIERAA